ncbi:6,7-dimethyl-8-ribityllumazine synthase [Ostreibacterium oceani]|uniref:6,7-dimethyl-8-ribityllumazine synthase n=1 Tax=Ostreibacterium oceani TaxID=2654998 RepID=A0A6N7EV29_9GAMM|nr:6,7-dimethyl-8-ribityllumazine synthase [Ostreibacterium oceani]MPV85289.1 6,7-dimethyl-8-ribityllumazine synthase [Ostreibacterium oceani]
MNPEIRLTEGDFVIDDARFAIVCSRFNHFIVDALEKGAIDALKRHGTDYANIEVFKAPGAYELALVAKQVAATNRFEAVIVLGAVIRGATAHFEYVSGPCASDISKVALDTGIPVVFGVLTTEDIEQAIERAGTKAGNKGAEAALTAIEMVSLLRQIN